MDNNNYSFKAESLTVHYFYTFLFSSFNLEDKINNSGEEEIIKHIFIDKFRLSDKLNVDIFWVGKESKTEKGFGFYLEPYLHLKMSRIEIAYPLSENIELFKWSENINRYELTNIEIHIKANIKILESGQGIIDLEISFYPKNQNFFNSENVVQLSNIGMRRKTLSTLNILEDKNLDLTEYKLVINNQEIFLFELFYNNISEIKSIFNYIFGDRLEWIEVNKKLVGDIYKYGNTLHFQDPFPMIILTLPDDIYAHAFLDVDQTTKLLQKESILNNDDFLNFKRAINKELLTLVFRSKAFGFPDASFAKLFCHFNDDRLTNMCSTSLVFLYIYSRTGIAIQAQNSISKKHSKYIIPAFVETVKYLRMRWHTYVVASQWLDKIIENLSDDNISFKNTLEMIVESRRDISRALCDPITFRLGSGSTYKIYDIGLSIFRIEDLEKIITTKFSMIDRLYTNLLDVNRIQTFEDMAKKPNS